MAWRRRRGNSTGGSGRKKMTQSQKIEKDIERCRRIAAIAGKDFDDFIDNRKKEKGLGDLIPIEIKLAALKIINEKQRKGIRINKDEASVALTQHEQELLREIKDCKVESSYDPKTRVTTITAWRLPPTINEWQSYFASEKQDAQAIWDGIMRKVVKEAPKPYDVPVMIEAQVYRSRLVDSDNLSSKNCMDAMKHCWLVTDDTPTYVKFYLNLPQIKCKKEEQKVVFRIFPYPDDVEFSWSFKAKPQDTPVETRNKKKKKKS